MHVKQLKYIIMIWLLALPLANFGGYFEGVKVLVYLIGCIGVTVYLVTHKLILHSSDYIYWLWLIILGITSLYGVHPAESFWGGSYRHQGVIFFLGLWVVLKFIELLDKKDKQIFLLAFLPLVCFESVLVVAQKLLGVNLLNARPMGTFGEPNATAGFLAVGMYLAIKGLKQIKLNRIIWFFIVLVLMAIFFTGSRTGLLAALFVLFWLTSPGLYRYVALVIVVALAFIVIQSGLHSRNDSIYENRITYWQMAVKGIKAQPLLGYGAESGEVFYNRAFAKAEMPLVGLIVDRSHNLGLDILLWSGIAGLAAFVIWFILRWKNSWGLVAWLIFASLQPLGVVHWLLLLLLFGL